MRSAVVHEFSFPGLRSNNDDTFMLFHSLKIVSYLLSIDDLLPSPDLLNGHNLSVRNRIMIQKTTSKSDIIETPNFIWTAPFSYDFYIKP